MVIGIVVVAELEVGIGTTGSRNCEIKLSRTKEGTAVGIYTVGSVVLAV